MRIAAKVTMLWMVATISHASIMEDMQDRDLSMVAVMQRALLGGTEVTDALRQALALSPQNATSIIGAAIAVTPGSISGIITTAIDANVEPESIAEQCKSALTIAEIEKIILSSLRAELAPEVILATCLGAVPEDTIALILAAALAASNQSQYDLILTSAFDAINALGYDGLSVVIDGMMQSNVPFDGRVLDVQEARSWLEGTVLDPGFATQGTPSTNQSTEAATLLQQQIPEAPASAS